MTRSVQQTSVELDTPQTGTETSPLAAPGVVERNCSVGRAIAILSDAWAFLVIRECLFGARRFDDFQARLMVPRQTLTERLKRLTEQGILKRSAYLDRPLRYEYRLTAMGIDLYPSMIAMLRFGDKWLDGVPRIPLRLIHKSCGCHSEPIVACSACGEELKAREVSYRDGPGAGKSAPVEFRRSRRSSDSEHYNRGRPSSVSRTLQIIGDRWTFKVTREAFLGARRFDEFEERLNIAPNILTDRLNRLVDKGIFERRLYQRLPDRSEYRLTTMGLDLYGPFVAILAWGDRWLSNDTPPMILTHKTCGQDFTPQVVCDKCRQPIHAWEMAYERNYDMTEDGEIRIREYDP
jgi:DNA-binding HxlR family transcriptional regulator